MKGSIPNVQFLIERVEESRSGVLLPLRSMSTAQGAFKPDSDSWSIAQILEHLTMAEQVGINGMWRAAQDLRLGQPQWQGQAVHRGCTIEEVVEATWNPKEVAPDVAKPRLGGPLQFWIAALDNGRHLLRALEGALQGLDPQEVIYPHPISGPLDALQRLDFLRFHIDRHRSQIDKVINNPDFPNAE